MTKSTKTTLLLSIIYCVFFIAALGSMAFVISNEGSKLEATKSMIAERAAKDAAYTNVMRILELSAADRAELEKYFITEKDTISFISELERAATALGVSLETTELSILPAASKDGVETPGVLTVGLNFEGDESAVKKFITLVESVPYRKNIPSFVVGSDRGTGLWNAHTILHITMKS